MPSDQQQQQHRLQRPHQSLDGRAQCAILEDHQRQLQLSNGGAIASSRPTADDGQREATATATMASKQLKCEQHHSLVALSDQQQQQRQQNQEKSKANSNGSTSDSSLSSSTSSPSSSASSSSSSSSSSPRSPASSSPSGSSSPGSTSSSSSSSSSSSNVTAFLSKLWRMVNDQANGNLIRWSQSGCSFVILNQLQFARDLLPLYFKHSNMASFIRQLNMYGFRKIPLIGVNGSSDQRLDLAQFYHVNFMRDQERRLSSIKRKNNSCKTHNLIVNGTFCDEVRSMLSDVKSIRDGQSSSESILGAIQVDNKSLWRDVAILRNQHHKQRRVIEKLIKFLLSLIQNRNSVVKKSKIKMMIEPSSSANDDLSGTPPANDTSVVFGGLPSPCDSGSSMSQANVARASDQNIDGTLVSMIMDSSAPNDVQQVVSLGELVGGQFDDGAEQIPVASTIEHSAATQHFVSSLCQTVGNGGAIDSGGGQAARDQLAVSEEIQLAAAAVAASAAGVQARPGSPEHSMRTDDTPTLANFAAQQQQYREQQFAQLNGRQTSPHNNSGGTATTQARGGGTPGPRVMRTHVPSPEGSPVCSPSPVVSQQQQQQRAAQLAARNANCQQWSNGIPTSQTSQLSSHGGLLYAAAGLDHLGSASSPDSSVRQLQYHQSQQQAHQHQLQRQQSHQNGNSNNHSHTSFNNDNQNHRIHHTLSNNNLHHHHHHQQQQQQHHHHLMATTTNNNDSNNDATGVMFDELAHRVPVGPTVAAASFLSALEQQTLGGANGVVGSMVAGSVGHQHHHHHQVGFHMGHHHQHSHHLHLQQHSYQQQQAQ